MSIRRSTMSYFRPDPAVAPLEELLNKLDAATAEDLSADGSPPPDVPTLEQFLNEEGKFFVLCVLSCRFFRGTSNSSVFSMYDMRRYPP